MRGTLFKRGDIWHVRYTNAKNNRTTTSTGRADKAEAHIWAEEYLSELERPRELVLVSDCLRGWREFKEKEGGNMYKTNCNVRRLLKHFSKLSPYEVRGAVDKYTSMRLLKVSKTTVARELGDLKASLNWAHDPRLGNLLEKPPEKIWFNASTNKRQTIASMSDLKKISDELENRKPFIRNAFFISLASAQRVQAVLDLTVDRIHWDINHIDFKNPNLKGKRKGRSTILIPEELKSLLKKCCEESQSGYVIERDGKPVSKPVLHHEWDNLRKKCNLKFLWWHDLRRTWATMAARNRVDMIQISRQLAHASMRITEEHYAHFHPDYMGQASDHSSQMLQNFLKPQ